MQIKMCDPTLTALLEQFSRTALAQEPIGVSFKGRGLKLDTAEQAKDVIDAIRDTPEMTFLDLEGNTLGVEAAKAIGEALKDRGKITRALWKDMFTGRMKEEIPKALKYLGQGLTAANAQLTELDLSDNAFGPIGVEALADLLQSRVCYKLQELRLNNNGLGITGGKMLAKALLEARSNSEAAGHPLALKVFIAGRNRLENDGATALSQVFKALGSLEEISMPQNGIYHKGISMLSDALQHNGNLRILNLNDNTLTVKGAKSLAAALPALQKLRILNLGDCLLKTEGAVLLADALSAQHNQLEELWLDSNEIRRQGGVALVQALGNKAQLNKLSLTGNEFGESGRRALNDEASKLNLRDIIDCPSDEDAEASGSEEGEEDDDDDDDETESGESSDDEGEKSTILKSPVATTPEPSKTSIDATILQFLMEPTPANFGKLAVNDVSAIIESMRIPPNCIDIETCVKLIMKISNLGSSKNDATRKRSRDVAIALYKALFSWADAEQQLSSVNNILFVYLQLIKDEDSQVKISWDVDRCVDVLKAAITEKIVPSFTEHILTCCLDRKSNSNNHSPQQITL